MARSRADKVGTTGWSGRSGTEIVGRARQRGRAAVLLVTLLSLTVLLANGSGAALATTEARASSTGPSTDGAGRADPGATDTADAADAAGRAVVVAEEQVAPRQVDLSISSPALDAVEKVRLLTPDGWAERRAGQRWPVLYLLHGCCGDYTSWTGLTDVASIPALHDVLVVMPEAGDTGFYSDWWNHGEGGPPAWETFHLREVRGILEHGYGAGSRRVVAGLSMGGSVRCRTPPDIPACSVRRRPTAASSTRGTPPALRTSFSTSPVVTFQTPWRSGAIPTHSAGSGVRTTRSTWPGACATFPSFCRAETAPPDHSTRRMVAASSRHCSNRRTNSSPAGSTTSAPAT